MVNMMYIKKTNEEDCYPREVILLNGELFLPQNSQRAIAKIRHKNNMNQTFLPSPKMRSWNI